jgi:hypothetical protein
MKQTTRGIICVAVASFFFVCPASLGLFSSSCRKYGLMTRYDMSSRDAHARPAATAAQQDHSEQL